MELSDFNFIELRHRLSVYLRNATHAEHMELADGSVTPVEFSWTVPDGFDFLFHGFHSHLIDNAAVNANGFGKGAELTNGIEIEILQTTGTVAADLLDGSEIHTNGDWGAFIGGDISQLGGSRGYTFDWEFDDTTAGRLIHIDEGMKFIWRINDDMTGLVHFEATINGVLIPKKLTQ
jgi:hypothetical protein